MRRVLRWLGRGLLAVLVLVLLLLSPIAYVETACRPQGTPAPYASILPEADQRPESRMLMTYPEWHIVHAYDDYARVIRDGDPHDYGFLRGIGGFWSSLCALSQASGAQGGVDLDLGLVVQVRHDQHPGGRRVDASLGLGDRDALHPVDAAFELEAGIGAAPVHGGLTLDVGRDLLRGHFRQEGPHPGLPGADSDGDIGQLAVGRRRVSE